jgi:hypothetical protein
MPIKLEIVWPTKICLDVDVCQQIVKSLRTNLKSGYFVDVVNDLVTVKNMFGSDNRVCDVDRYNIRNDRKDNTDLILQKHTNFEASKIKGNFKDLVPNNKFKNIVLILESPHKDEYKKEDNKLIPIAPAQANQKNKDTGYAIETFFTSKILSQIEDIVIKNDSRVIITNPIQYQASLHNILGSVTIERKLRGCLRDSVWKSLWSVKKIRLDFFSRLTSYQPYLIINACTGGTSDRDSDGLNGLISQFLIENKFWEKSYKTGHPSSVWFKTNSDGTPNSKVLPVCAVKAKLCA